MQEFDIIYPFFGFILLQKQDRADENQPDLQKLMKIFIRQQPGR